MATTPRSRDRLRLAVTTLTALVTAGSLAAVGWLAGSASRGQQAKLAHEDAVRALAEARSARAHARYEARWAAARSASFPHRVVLRPRPQRTVVSTHYVAAASTPVTLGGTTASQPSTTPTAPAHRPPSHPASSPPPPPPPPSPPPAPSTGS